MQHRNLEFPQRFIRDFKLKGESGATDVNNNIQVVHNLSRYIENLNGTGSGAAITFTMPTGRRCYVVGFYGSVSASAAHAGTNFQLQYVQGGRTKVLYLATKPTLTASTHSFVIPFDRPIELDINTNFIFSSNNSANCELEATLLFYTELE